MLMVKEALQRLRNHYADNKAAMPSQQKIADQTGLSESTVQRALSGTTDNIKYATITKIASVIGLNTSDLGINEETVAAMDNDDLQALVLALREINMKELSAQREADDIRWRERLNADQEKYKIRIDELNREHTDELRRINQAHVEEMKRLSAEHAEEMKRSNNQHDEHVTQIHKMYDRQMESMRSANAKQMEMMLDGHKSQIEAIQRVDQTQQEAVQSMAETQKAADEKSKDFLMKEIEQRDSRIAELDARDKDKNKRDNVKNLIIFCLIAMFFMLFFVDFLLPSIGWIRRTSQTLFSYHYYG